MAPKEKKVEDKIPSLTKIDKIIHEPARLMIISYLYVIESADMIFLKGQTGLTWSNLYLHIN